MADANWSSQLHTALEEWAAIRPDRAAQAFHRVLAGCQGDEMTIWRAFVENQLALLCQETGQWEQARHHWEAAQKCWSAAGLKAGSSELSATLDWFGDLLEHYRFPERALHLRRQHRISRPPLIDPWLSENDPPTAIVPAAAAPEPGYAPMGGKTVSTQRNRSSDGTWDELLTRALELAGRANFPRAQNLFDEARHRVVDRRVTHPHLLALVYCAESIGAFLAGCYSQAERARDTARELWRTPERDREDLQRFALALRAAGQESAAVLFMSRSAQNQFPLIDPWTDLHTGVARGEWQAPEAPEWMPRLEEALEQFVRGNLYECRRLLDNLGLQLDDGPAREVLLGNLQALLAHAQGEESEARTFYNRARTRCIRADSLEPELALLRRYKLEKLADALKAGHLLDPFDHPLPTQIGTALPGPKPRLLEPSERQSPPPPAKSNPVVIGLLVAILLTLGVAAWKLAYPHEPQPPQREARGK
ncbi:MAG: hypothetical protein KF760_22005 [Candidatus Eremiobacteraeota bacterium]|nr:hypothetical protein [Candidatus Eremiobacteraeota bacterium]MCW5866547.1 hypothetical protein [Candidatus Eremiobacteraeota bacterium]